MITLALDTSTERGAVALLRDDQPLFEETFSRLATPQLFGAIQRALRQARLGPGDVDLFAVGVGPGSFTGIRVGIAAAKGLALPQSRPLKAANSFDALMRGARARMPRDCGRACVFCDAKRGEVCFAWYDAAGQRTGDCQLGPLETLTDGVHEPVWFVSPEIERFAPELRALAGGFANLCPTPLYPSAAALGALARERFEADGRRGDPDPTPIYLRQPQYKKTIRPSHPAR